VRYKWTVKPHLEATEETRASVRHQHRAPRHVRGRGSSGGAGIRDHARHALHSRLRHHAAAERLSARAAARAAVRRPPLGHLRGDTLDLLFLQTLLFGPRHGHGIATTIQRTSNDVLLVDHGSLYPALQRLERAGLITSEWRISENKRRASYYTLTRAGRARFQDETGKWQELVRAMARVFRPRRQEGTRDSGDGSAGARIANLGRRSRRTSTSRRRISSIAGFRFPKRASPRFVRSAARIAYGSWRVRPTRCTGGTRSGTQPVYQFQPLEQSLSESLVPGRFNMLLLQIYAASAAFMALAGTFGVVARSVARRTRETAVRIALGARPAAVVFTIVRQAMGYVLLGIGLGVVTTLGGAGVMRGMLYGVEPHDPPTISVISAGLAAAALVACGLPALKAATVDPAVALREE
jgi:PadR family transcriptional regulator PadR